MEGTHAPAGYNGVDSTHGSHGAHGDIEAVGRNMGNGERHNHHPEARLGNETPARMLDDKGVDSSASSVDEKYTDSSEENPAAAQILGVAILEFGVVFHSVRGYNLSLRYSS